MRQQQSRTHSNEEIAKMLNELIQLDYDAIAAYEAAIERLEDRQASAKLTEFMNDHVEHTRNLAALVRQHGGNPKQKGDLKKVLTKGKVIIANLAGDDAILKAMRINEDLTNESYEKAAQTPGLPAAVRTTLQANLADERRHREWIVSQLAS